MPAHLLYVAIIGFAVLYCLERRARQNAECVLFFVRLYMESMPGMELGKKKEYYYLVSQNAKTAIMNDIESVFGDELHFH